MPEQELYHFGVKGMKWGVRKGRKKSSGGKRKRATARGVISGKDKVGLKPGRNSKLNRKLVDAMNKDTKTAKAARTAGVTMKIGARYVSNFMIASSVMKVVGL